MGDGLELFVDSGIRRGVDVVAALSREVHGPCWSAGRRSTVWSRPGEDGVRAVLEIFRAELENALHLCGVATVTDVPRDLVVSI